MQHQPGKEVKCRHDKEAVIVFAHLLAEEKRDADAQNQPEKQQHDRHAHPGYQGRHHENDGFEGAEAGEFDGRFAVGFESFEEGFNCNCRCFHDLKM